MTDLQLGLLVVGAVVVAGVLLYNRLQERAARGEAERIFGSRHADALLAEAAERREPAAGPLPSEKDVPPADAMPDPRVDYVIDLTPQRPVAAGTVLEHWAPVERRFGKRVLLAASDGPGWRRLHAGDPRPCSAVRAGLQLVSRTGVTGDAEVLEFRSAVETLAARIGAAIAAPEMRAALDSARALDRVCADADIQVALHVVGGSFTDEGIKALGEHPFQILRRGEDLTLTLDVPRVADIGRSYEAMARVARHLAASQGGRLVDDHGKTLDDQALASIGAQLEPTRLLLAEHGIESGSPLALRLFS